MARGLITELQAINEVLSVAGDAAVQSVDSDYEQAVIARRILEETSREEQSVGWWFNELVDIEISSDTDGSVSLPSNTIDAEIHDDTGLLVQRGLRIFNRKENTYVIGESVVANIIEFLEWDFLPQVFRQYVVQVAKERYNTEYFGSKDVERVVAISKQSASVRLQQADIDGRDINMLNNSRAYNIAFRNRR